MCDNKETDSKNALNSDDVELWREMTRDVKRMEGRDYVPAKSLDAPKNSFEERVVPVHVEVLDAPKKSVKILQGVDVDRRTMQRLKRGEMAIEGRLDLHGMNQGEAREALIRFIRGSYIDQKRCVLVVTGKGNTGRRSEDWLDPKPGVLKQNVPMWLREGELAEIVLQTAPAQPRDGGGGALYVYLRRRRD